MIAKRKISLLLVLSILLLGLVVGCAPTAEEVSEPEEEVAEPEEVEEPEATVDSLDIVYLSPSTESGYWGEYVRIGVENAILDIEEKYGIEVNYDYTGPVAENQQDEYLATLEAVIAQQPDGIVLGQLFPEAVGPLVKQATEMGIRVNLISIGLDLPGDQFGQLFYCDQPEQGKLGAEAYVAALEKKGLPMDGVTGMHMSVVVPVLEAKLDMFRETLQGLAPDMEITDTQYNENDVNNGIALMEAQLATYGDDLVGFFAGNNVTGDAVARVIEESGRADTLVGIVVDSDPAEIEALRNGYLDGIVVQTPYDQAYGATMGIAEFIIDGVDGEDMVNMPASVVTPENMDDPDMAALLDPTLLKREE